MRWEGQRQSDNIEDRRGMGPVRPGVGIGLGGIVLVLAVSFLTGTNPLQILNMIGGIQDGAVPSDVEAPGPTQPLQDQLGKFASVVLAWQRETRGDRPLPGREGGASGGAHAACRWTLTAAGRRRPESP